MSKTYKTIIIALSLIAVGLIYFLFFKRSESDILYKIPKNATTIAIIDCRALSAKLFIKELSSDSSLFKQLFKHVPESLKSADWSSTGIGIPNKIALFTLEDTISDKINFYYLSTISSHSRFNGFMNDVCTAAKVKVNKRHGLHWVINTRYKLLIAWNNKYVTGIKTTKTIDESLKTAASILGLQKEQSIMSNPAFVQKQSQTYDIFVFSRKYHYCSVKYLNELNPEIESLFAYIHLNKGALNIEAEIMPQNGSILEKILSRKNTELPTLQSNNAIINLKTNVDPLAFQILLNKLKIVDFKATLIPSLNSWNGLLNLVFFGIKNVQTNYTSYEYDDDFNKIEVSKSVNESMMNIQAVFGQKDSPILLRTGKDTVLYKGGNFLLKKQQNYFYTYNKYFTPLASLSENFTASLFLFFNFKKLQYTLKEAQKENLSIGTRFPVESAEMTLNSSGKLKATFHFNNKNENVVYGIVDGLLKP